jgi:hypothetical protein
MMNIEYVKDCVYANAGSTVINCTVKFAEFNEEHPFSSSVNDPEEHGREIYARIIAGEFGPIAPYVAPVITTEIKVSMARNHRDQLLGQMDAIISNPLRWTAMTTEQQAAWSAYRQALLDVPQQAGFPETINWPVAPT